MSIKEVFHTYNPALITNDFFYWLLPVSVLIAGISEADPVPIHTAVLFPCCCCSVTLQTSFRLHGLQHVRFHCPSLSPGVCLNSCPLSQWCHPTISSSVIPFSSASSLQSFPSSGSFLMSQLFLSVRRPKYWRFSFSICPSNEYSGLISYRIDWFDLLAIQGTLKSLLQHHSSKASVLRHPAFFIV